MKKVFCLLFVALICIQDFAECKRTVSGGRRKKTSSRSHSHSTRRQSSHVTSRPKKPSAPAPDYNNKPAGALTITRNPAPPTYRSLNNANYNAPSNMYPGPPSNMHQSPPSYYSPEHLPPGAVLYPVGQVPKQSSGPGFGTGLVAGAIGGAILEHALTPSHKGGKHAQRTSSVSQPAPDSHRIIIINNGPPGSVTTTNGAGTTVIDNTGSAAAVAPAAAPAVAHPDPATPLAPFQPGLTQEVNNQNNANSQMAPAAVAAPIAGGATLLEPIAAATDPAANNQTAQAGPQPGSVVCHPIMVNQTDPADPTKQKEVEQIACYEVPQNPPLASLDQQNTSQQPSLAEQSQMLNNPAPAVTTIENYTQKTSSATVAQSAQIKESGALNLIPICSSYLMQ